METAHQSWLHDLCAWLGANGLDLAQTAGVLGALFVAIFTSRDAVRATRINIGISLTTSHRDLWSWAAKDEKLSRILSESVDLHTHPITRVERLFVILAVSHLRSAFDAHASDLFLFESQAMFDVLLFFKLPIPKAVWSEIRAVQDEAFVHFVEGTTLPAFR